MPPAGSRRAAVLGSPIAHSLSPVLHAAAYRELGLDWTYEAIEVDEPGLAGFLAALGPEWAGLSLTMPLKREALSLASSASDTARLVHGANTLVPGADGWAADNTDVDGLVAALTEAGAASTIAEAAILGAGATGESALLSLARLGVDVVRVAARRPGPAADALQPLARSQGVDLEVVPWVAAPEVLRCPVVVSSVPKGVTDELVAAVPAVPGLLFDVVYDPWPTPLAAAWGERGGAVLGGLDLLVHQAVLQVELMTGGRPSVETLRDAGRQALAARTR